MQAHTFTQKASSNWLSWRTLFSLLSLFVGLGSSQSAQAQTVSSIYYNDGIVLTRQTVGSTIQDSNHNYAGLATEAPYSGYDKLGKATPSLNLGTYDLSGTSKLILNGGSIEADPPQSNKSASYTISATRLRYRVYAQGTSTQPTYTSLDLPRNGSLNGSQFYSNSTDANINLLSGLAVGGTYILEVVFQTDTQGSNGTTNTDQDPVTSTYQASFVLNAPTPPSFVGASPNTILINPNNSGDVSYTTTAFNGADLKSFDVNTGKLLLNGGTSTTTENGTNNITDVSLYYRVHSTNTAGGGFSFVSLAQTQVVTNSDGTRTRSFSLNGAAQNLLNNISTSNTYSIDTYFVASYTNGSNNFTVRDDNGGNYYVATFTVTGTPILTIVWTGGIDDNWFNPQNWNPQQVPTATTNARIPDFPSGSNITYPNIYSNVVKKPVSAMTTTNPDGTTNTIPATPGYDNTNSGNAMVRDLTMSGTSPTQRSILRLIVGRLDVFGDFNNPQQSFIQRANTTISFKSQSNQTISGNTNGFTNVEIDGAAGSIKTLSSIFNIKSGGSLKFINGILQTDISQTDTNFISFDAATTEVDGTVTPAGRLLNETNDSYFRGYLLTTQTASPGSTQDFSNIGLSLTFIGSDPGPVFVSRNTAGNYAPTAFGGSTPKPGIRRVFGVQPNNPGTNSGGLNATVQFAYLDNELVNLRVNTTNPPDYSGSVDKSKLALYVSTTGGNTFSQLGRDTNNNNVLVKSGVTTFATFTLSEQQTPLPVKLISFDAKRTGSNALVTWATAVEISNSGFEVQVSTDGTTFRKLAFVASQAINSTGVLKYSFLDEENGKTGTRYYRLRQIDEDGKDDFSPVRVVSFSATSVTQATTLTAYPNPFNNNDLPVILVQAAAAGDATLQVIDMMGRVITRQAFTTAAGIQEVSISQASNLSSGVYMAKVTLATGEVKTIRIQKR